MLTPTNKKKLRTLGHSLSPLVQIGKGDLTEGLLKDLDVQLEAHELVKVSLLKTAGIPVRQAALDCAAATHSDIVHIVGRTFLLYRKSKENRLGIKG